MQFVLEILLLWFKKVSELAWAPKRYPVSRVPNVNPTTNNIARSKSKPIMLDTLTALPRTEDSPIMCVFMKSLFLF